jgi:hypothetical protein
MTALANVAITDTFDTLRVRVNQTVEKGNQEETRLTTAYDKANTVVITANAAFAKANAALSNTSGAVFSGTLKISDNVSIGNTAAVSYGLYVEKPASNTHVSVTAKTANTVSGSFAEFVAYSNNGTEYAQLSSASQSIGALVFNTSVAGYIYTTTSTPLIFQTNSTERMRITPTGNVAIGGLTAAATLDVTGDISTAKANTLAQTLTDAATISWDASLGRVATVTLGGNRTMSAPTNLRVGEYILHVIQDGTGSRTITWNSVFKWANGTAPTLTTTASRRDLITFVCDGTNLYGRFLADMR